MKNTLIGLAMATSVTMSCAVYAQIPEDNAPQPAVGQEIPVDGEKSGGINQMDVVNDGGVETVRDAEEAAVTQKLPPSPKDALDDVKRWNKGKGWKFGRWDNKKKRLIVVVAESFDCDDPAKMKDVMVQRDMATKRAVLQAKAEIIQFVKAEVDAEDIVEMMGGNAPGVSEVAKKSVQQQAETFKGQKMKQKSIFATFSELPLFGATCIKQSESWNRGKYQIALAMAWSPALERAARGVLTGEKVICKPKENGKTVEEWIESVNPAFMSGPMQFVDNNGKRWFFGISGAAADEDLDALTLKANKRIADLSAQQMLVFSLWGDVQAYEKMRQELETTSLDGKSETEVAQWMESKVSQAVKGLPIRGMVRLYSDEVEHPVTGGNIYVSIYGINQDDATTSLKIEARNIATRAEIERVKTIERGRAAANKALIDGAKNDPRDFRKGYNAQNQSLHESSKSQNGTQNVQQKEDPKKRDKKAKAGVFSGGSDTDDDF